MALINCEECSREISNRAAACPHCGCPVSDKPVSAPDAPPLPEAWQQQPAAVSEIGPAFTTSTTSTKKVLGYVGLVLVVLFGIAICSQSNQGSTTAGTSSTAETAAAAAMAAAKEAEDAAALAAPPPPEQTQVVAGGQWGYASREEGMSGKSVRTASVLSTNTINLDFPYTGSQHATLELRRHPRWGNDVILSIERGQLLCHSYGDCAIGVRFDDGKLLRFDGNPPADNSTEYTFIPAFSTFMKQLPKTKKVRIEVQIYQAGSQVFEFDVSGFDASKFR